MAELKLFGTDGIRGRPGEFPLDGPSLQKLGFVFSRFLSRHILKPSQTQGLILFIRDTRQSGSSIYKHMERGFIRGRYIPQDLGVLPTPAMAYLVPSFKAVLGCVISASHNPPMYNGIKFFDGNGQKIPQNWERKIEAQLLEGDQKEHFGRTTTPPPLSKQSRHRRDFLKTMFSRHPELDVSQFLGAHESGGGAKERYIDFLRSRIPVHYDFRNLKIAIDSAHGAASNITAELFESLGARVFKRGASPNGHNINVNSGALHPAGLRALVRRWKADIGFALDGDGDRLVIIDEKGEIVPGEWVLASVSLARKKLGEPGSGALVTTTVSNWGLKRFLEKHGLPVIETNVGDRWVLEALQKEQLGFGGENSGHYIWPLLLPSADGTLSALLITHMLREKNCRASQLFAKFPLLPHVAITVPAPTEKPPLGSLKSFSKEFARIKRFFNHKGRILVRYSGTEPVLRIMLEGDAAKSALTAMTQALRQAYVKSVE